MASFAAITEVQGTEGHLDHSFGVWALGQMNDMVAMEVKRVRHLQE